MGITNLLLDEAAESSVKFGPIRVFNSPVTPNINRQLKLVKLAPEEKSPLPPFKEQLHSPAQTHRQAQFQADIGVPASNVTHTDAGVVDLVADVLQHHITVDVLISEGEVHIREVLLDTSKDVPISL